MTEQRRKIPPPSLVGGSEDERVRGNVMLKATRMACKYTDGGMRRGASWEVLQADLRSIAKGGLASTWNHKLACRLVKT